MSGWRRADTAVPWKLGAGGGCCRLKSGVMERCCCSGGCASGPVKGLVLLGRAGSGSVNKGPGEALRVSWERLRDATGGGGGRSEAAENGDGVESEEEEEEEESRACRSDRAGGRWEKDEGRVFENGLDAGAAGGARRDEPRVRDWVVIQEEDGEENRSHASVSKGSAFHCASLWNPFSPLV